MKCAQARRLFGAYWDDEVTQAEREWLEAHFTSCPDCRAAYDDLGRTLELVGSLPRAEVSPDFAERVLARTRRATAERDRVPSATPRWIPVTAAAALLAVLAATVFQWTGSPLSRRGGLASRSEVSQPTLIARGQVVGAAPAPAGESDRMIVDASGAIPDSIFDHSDDVEFILDPVTLRKGRAHTVVDVPQDKKRAQQAVITF